MSLNHFSAALPESFWRPQPQKCQPPGFGFDFDFNLNLNRNEHDREPLFEKLLTPSDVGKLNRLVIPKQHAERCFPLGGMGMGMNVADSGMLLSFEDESGKCWRFRYSYWSSSQSYVLTKGWSRYVKEKMLDAGDVVIFQRHRVNGDRLFIGWRRRDAAAAETTTGEYTENSPFAPIDLDLDLDLDQDQNQDHYGANHAGSAVCPPSSGNSKRFRLFGVNMEFFQHPDHGCQSD